MIYEASCSYDKNIRTLKTVVSLQCLIRLFWSLALPRPKVAKKSYTGEFFKYFKYVLRFILLWLVFKKAVPLFSRFFSFIEQKKIWSRDLKFWLCPLFLMLNTIQPSFFQNSKISSWGCSNHYEIQPRRRYDLRSENREIKRFWDF
jgi:hypothetical protein